MDDRPLTPLPGNFNHQQILQRIVDFYAGDGRVRSILLFGSLGRGNWDEYSDLDLDIILADDAAIDARVELERLCRAMAERDGLEALVIADEEEGDVVLGNLVQFSIRYHILSDTKPAILDTMRVVAGSLSLAEIRAAANHAYDSGPSDLADIVNQYLRYALGLHDAIRRGRVWMSLEMLHRMRGLLMEMQAVAHGEIRPIHYLDLAASPEVQGLLAGLVAGPTLASLSEAFAAALNLLEKDLDLFSDGAYELTGGQTAVLDRLRYLAGEMGGDEPSGPPGHK